MGIEFIITLIKIMVVVSIFFVWVVRYSNIEKEFKEYGFANWFRDVMGIIKLSACGMILSGQTSFLLLAAIILGVLMCAAFIVHIKVKHTLIQMLPSFSLMCASIILGLSAVSLF